MEHVMRFIKATEGYNTFDVPVAAPYLRRAFTCAAITTRRAEESDRAGDGRERRSCCLLRFPMRSTPR